jgi:hypothetical protein
MTSITLPNSLKMISMSMLDGCRELTSITIPNSVMAIGEFAFYDCRNLTSITIPDSVRAIDKNAFAKCGKLTIHAEAGKPDGWRRDWNPDNRPVIWGCKGV